MIHDTNTTSMRETPGPWRYRFGGYGQFGAERWRVGARDTTSGIKYAQTVEDVVREVALVNYEGDARLIAAAPELLAALKGILKAIEAGNPVQTLRAGNGFQAVVVDSDMEPARATIAKATGQEVGGDPR